MRSLILIGILLTTAAWIACGGGSSSSSTTADDTVSITGTVMAPVSTNIATPNKGFIKTVADAAAAAETCHIYTLEGEDLGEVTTDSSGTFSMDVDIDTLQGSDDTGTTWTEDVILQTDSGMGLHAEITVTEGTTTTIDLGTADTDSTLAVFALTGQISGWNGWGHDYTDVVTNMDLTCIYKAQKALWEDAALAGEGLADDSGAIKETIMAYMAGGGEPADAGYSNWGDMMHDVLAGSATDEWSAITGVADDYISSDYAGEIAAYSSAFNSFNAVNSVFAAQFATGGTGMTALNISKADADTGSICDDIKSGALDAGALVGPMMAAGDLTAFAATYGDAEGIVVHFGLLEQCMTAGGTACDDMATDGGAYYGFMAGYGGDFSEIWSGGEFDSTALEGTFYAAQSCEGATQAEMEDCALGMYGTVHAAGWESFKTDGEFDVDNFDYWGGYYTTQVEGGTFDPATHDSGDYASVWEAGSDVMNNTEFVDAIEGCKQTMEQGHWDTCYTDPAGGGGQTITIVNTISNCTSLCSSLGASYGALMAQPGGMCSMSCPYTQLTCANFCTMACTSPDPALGTISACTTSCSTTCTPVM